MLVRAITTATFATLLVPSAFASEPVPKLGSGIPLREASPYQDEFESTSLFYAPGANTYQIGDEWGKKPVNAADLAQTPKLLRAARATAQLGGATGFYLGRFNGEAVVATNHHVCPTLDSCVGRRAHFPLLGKSLRVKQSLGTWTTVDLSLVTVEIRPEDEALFASVASNFDFQSPLKAGQRLFTAGFGVAENPNQELVANQDADCKVFSGDGVYTLMSDPDELNPGTYAAWSFANGCDVSHGDSGSAMVDRETGKPIGLIWTGKIPKSPYVQSSTRISSLVGSDDRLVWTELSYGVPAAKIKEYLTELVQDGSLSEDVRPTVAAVVGVEGSL
jgi:hypothetical protein